MALREAKDAAWTYKLFEDLLADPAVCIISYCLPCVTYGQNAEAVHGPAGSCLNHGLKYYLYSCICLCGLVAGPTRKGLRTAYRLPAEPAGFGDEANTDCLVHTIPCLACFAHCQEANEIKVRKLGAPVDPRPFDWAPVSSTPAAALPAPGPVVTVAPVQAEMSKGEAAPAAPAAMALPVAPQ